jgi:hypothetical protein
MKLWLLLAIGILFTPASQAGVFGWLTADEKTWASIQATGGLKIAEPVQHDGKWFLPVEYDPHGARAVTRRPTTLQSAPHACKVKILRKGERLHLIVITSLASMDEKLDYMHEASLRDIPAGRYEVFYGRKSIPAQALGTILIPGETPRSSSL